MDTNEFQKSLRDFTKERDWEQFFTAKNLIMAMTGEVGELCEVFQWLTDEEVNNIDDRTKEEASQELADIFIYLVKLFDVLDIDITEAINNKMLINHDKYPINLSKSNAVKYNKRGS